MKAGIKMASKVRPKKYLYSCHLVSLLFIGVGHLELWEWDED